MPRFGGRATMTRLPKADTAAGLDACFVAAPFDSLQVVDIGDVAIDTFSGSHRRPRVHLVRDALHAAEVWNAWVGDDSQTPARATMEARLASPQDKVLIQVMAALR